MHFPEEMKDSQKDAANARCKKFLVRRKCNTAVILRKGPGGAATASMASCETSYPSIFTSCDRIKSSRPTRPAVRLAAG